MAGVLRQLRDPKKVHSRAPKGSGTDIAIRSLLRPCLSEAIGLCARGGRGQQSARAACLGCDSGDEAATVPSEQGGSPGRSIRWILAFLVVLVAALFGYLKLANGGITVMDLVIR